jgi:plastocyanin
MPRSSLLHAEMPRKASVVVVGAFLFMVSGLALALPFAHAQSAVMVSIPRGAGSDPSGAPGYAPDNVTVVIGINDTVTWTNNDNVHHTVTPSDEPAGGVWSGGSGDLAPGASYSFTFTVPGTYAYQCSYHSWMTGAVVVKDAASTTTSTSTTPEFPAAWLAVILFAVLAAVIAAAPRLRPGRASTPSV